MIIVNLKQILKEKNITMHELHQATGISQNTLSLFANQKSTGVQYPTLEKILRFLDVKIEDLIQFSNSVYSIDLKTSVSKLEESTILTTNVISFNNTDIKGEHYTVEMDIEAKIVKEDNGDVEYLLLKLLTPPTFSDLNFQQNFNFEIEKEVPDLFKVLSYLLTNKIMDTLSEYKYSIYTTVLFTWSALVPHFYFGNYNYESSVKNKKISKTSNNTVFIKKEFLVRLVPVDPFKEYSENEVIYEVAPHLDSLNNLDCIAKIDFDKNTNSRKLYITFS